MDLLGPQSRYSAGARDDVPKSAPIFGQHPATNERRMVRYGQSAQVPESKQQLLINALRNMPGRITR